MGRKRLRAAARRDQIISVATSLFESQGYHSTTMEQIAQECDIAKASLDYYFASKEQLLVALHEEMMTALLDKQAARLETEMSGGEILHETIRDCIGLMDSHPGRLRIFFEARRALPAEFRAEISEQRRQYRLSVVETVRRGIDDGEFIDCDPEMAALAMLGMCNWSLQWYRPNGRLSSEAIADQFWAMFSTGLVKPLGA
jgi:AcrR family transcriptional regulator